MASDCENDMSTVLLFDTVPVVYLLWVVRGRVWAVVMKTNTAAIMVDERMVAIRRSEREKSQLLKEGREAEKFSE